MKIEIEIPNGCYKEIKEAKFPAQDTYRLIEWIKEGRIIDDENDDLVEIMTLHPGTAIEVGGIQLEILDNTYIGKGNEVGVLCLTKDILFKKAFDEGNNNNWEKSSLREYLNGEYEESLDEEFASALLPFKRDLITDDAMKDYGTCVDLISLISCDEYREYREYISDKSDWWWTLTAWSAKPGYSYYARGVFTDGSLNSGHAYSGYSGVSPAFLLKPSTKVKVEERDDG